MDYPINDIFECTGELLLNHGKHITLNYSPELPMTDTYIEYGERIYKIRYVSGELCEIVRLPSKSTKESDNGKN